ncbi:MAG: type IV secretion system protein [Solitalea-like symbiont of Acarus siro]
MVKYIFKAIAIFLIVFSVHKSAFSQYPVYDYVNYTTALERLQKLKDGIKVAKEHVDKVLEHINTAKDTYNKVTDNYNLAKKKFDELRHVKGFYDTYYKTMAILDGITNIVSTADSITNKYLNSNDLSEKSKAGLSEINNQISKDLDQVLEDYERVARNKNELSLTDYERLTALASIDLKKEEIKEKLSIVEELLAFEKKERTRARYYNRMLEATWSPEMQTDLQKQMKQAFGLAIEIADYFRIIAVIGIALHVVLKTFSCLNKGETITITPFKWPLIILFCLTSYSVVIQSVDYWIIKPLNKVTADLANGKRDILNKVSKAEDETPIICNPNEIPSKKDEGVLSKWWNNGITFLRKKYSDVTGFAWTILLKTVYKAVSLLWETISEVFLILLISTGPIAIALSAFDPFKNYLTRWLSYLINIGIWGPVGNLLIAIAGNIVDITTLRGIDKGQDITFYDWLSGPIYHLTVLACLISTPIVSNMIVSGSQAALGAMSASINAITSPFGGAGAVVSRGSALIGQGLKGGAIMAGKGAMMAAEGLKNMFSRGSSSSFNAPADPPKLISQKSAPLKLSAAPKLIE